MSPHLLVPPSSSSPQPLAPSPSFWQYNEPLDATLVVITPSPSSDTVLDILGAIPIAELDTQPTTKNNSQPETSAEVVKQYLDNVYQQTSQQAVLTAMNTEG